MITPSVSEEVVALVARRTGWPVDDARAWCVQHAEAVALFGGNAEIALNDWLERDQAGLRTGTPTIDNIIHAMRLQLKLIPGQGLSNSEIRALRELRRDLDAIIEINRDAAKAP